MFSVVAALGGMYAIDQQSETPNQFKIGTTNKSRPVGPPPPEKSAEERRQDVRDWVQKYRERVGGASPAKKEAQEWIQKYRERIAEGVNVRA